MAVYDLNQIDNMPQLEHAQKAEGPVEPHVTRPSTRPRKTLSKKGKKILKLALLALLVLGLAAEPFLLLGTMGEPVSVVESRINEYGELVIYYSDGSSQNLGTVARPDGGDNGSGSDIASAVAKGLRSAVSVWCTFYSKEDRADYYTTGSGVIYQLDKQQGDAFIITNYHVVYDAKSATDKGIAKEIIVYLYGGEIKGREIKATYVGGSQNYDIAVLRVEDSDILRNSAAAAATVADSDRVIVGSTAIAVGNPEGNRLSTTIGVVSVDSEYITMLGPDGKTEVSYRVMRIDAAVNHGNSGGGLFDDQGRLIGIVNAKTVIDDVENIGYALPTSTVTAVADNIIDYCFGKDCTSVQRPIMGVTVTTVDSSAVYDAVTDTVRIVETVEIYEVSPGQIGAVFKKGDVLVSVSLGDRTKTITRQHHVIDMMLNARVGDEVVFEVMRDGKIVALTVIVTEKCLTAY